MPLFPAAVLPWIAQQFLDADGNPLAGGKLYSYEAGTVTPLPLYTDVNLTTPATNPVILDSTGQPATVLYVLAQGYKYKLTDADDNVLWTRDEIEDVGATFASQFGLVLAEGSKNVVSGYQVLTTDRLVTVNSFGGADPCVIQLPAAADATQPLTIKNLGNIALAVTPDGSDTVDTLNAAYEVPAAVDPLYPTITLVPDGVSAWFITSSHGIA